eukprot:m.43660 g.43660  ORF g.43660 m.43660 type:complete len:655 (+) comp33462_c0_seq5:190-2154(+)
MTAFPEPRSDHLSAIVQNEMLVWGGKSPEDDQFFSHDIVWNLDLSTTLWSKRQSTFATFDDVPHDSAGSRIAVGENGDIYQFGGGFFSRESSTWEYFNDLHKLNGRTLQWQKVLTEEPLPPERDACGLCLLGDKLVLFGGGVFFQDGKNGCLYDDVWVFPLNGDHWSLIPCQGNTPTRRFGHTFTAIDRNNAVLIGGRAGKTRLNSYIFNLDMKEWTEILLTSEGNTKVPRFGHSTIFVDLPGNNRHLFVFCGSFSSTVVIDLSTMDIIEIDLSDFLESSRQTVCSVCVQSSKVHFIRFGGNFKEKHCDFSLDKLEWDPSISNGLSSIDVNEPSPSKETPHDSVQANYNILKEDIEYDEENDFISSGSFGEVYKAKIRGKVDVAALKIFFRKRRSTDESRLLNKEASILMRIKPHFHIVKLIGICDTPRCYALLMEFASGGDLTQLLMKPEHDPRVERWLNRLDISHQVASGMAHLHKNFPPVIHLDLKSNNVLIDVFSRERRPFICKICDFGLSKMSGVSSLSKSRKSDAIPSGTVAYIAPERYQIVPYECEESEERKEVAKKSDVFSYGVLLWEIREKEHPFKGNESIVVHMHIKSGKGLPEGRLSAPDGFDELVKVCSSFRPEDRPLFTQVTKQLGKILRKFTELKSISPE